MKIYFIEAERDRTQPPTSDWFDTSMYRFFCPSLALPNMASLTPSDIEIKIIDEKIEDIDLSDIPDIAAISYKTMSSKRAYHLADDFRKRGTKVILGGIHASLLPDEAKKNCDSVVVGEGENLWPLIVNDLRSNQLKPLYRTNDLMDLSGLEVPRFDLLKNDKYLCHSIQTSRGCSLNCDFCPTREMFGGIFRTKPIKNVLEEIRTALSIEKKYIFFNDDIFGAGDRDFVLELLREIKKLRIEFFITSDFLVLNKKIVTELARSGCRYIALNLPGTCSPEEARAIKMIQNLGIDVWGYFMFGFRFHQNDVFKKVYEFIEKTKMRHASFTVMAPYPNTMAGKELDKQKRILSKDWTLYDQAHIIFEPEKMNVAELEKGFNWIKKELGRLSRFSSNERRSPWKTFTGRCLAEISAILPQKSRKN